jgi:hypothetical protein
MPGGDSSVKNFSLISSTIRLRSSVQVRARTDYVVLETSKPLTPLFAKARVIRMFRKAARIIPASTTDIASTIADPTMALENALKWLKETLRQL